MKILIIRTSPGVVGGAELSACDQALVLKELGHKPVLATNLKPLKKRASDENIKTAWFPWINRGPSKLRIVFFFLLMPVTYFVSIYLAFRYRPDIISPHGREDQIAFTFSRFLHRRPVIWKDPGDLRTHFGEKPLNPLKKLYKYFFEVAARKADHIYSLNDDDRKLLAERVGINPKRQSSIPTSILFRNYNLKAEPISRPSDKLVVGSLCRAEEEKGIQNLVSAAKSLPRDKYEFWIANHGNYSQELVRQANGQKNIRFFDYVSDVSSYYKSLDVFVHVPISESWGRVIKEAMYFGLPIVGTNVGGVKRQINDGKSGFLIDYGDTQTLIDLLKRLEKDPQLRKKIGTSAQKEAEEAGDFSKIVKEQILPLYKKFI